MSWKSVQKSPVFPCRQTGTHDKANSHFLRFCEYAYKLLWKWGYQTFTVQRLLLTDSSCSFVTCSMQDKPLQSQTSQKWFSDTRPSDSDFWNDAHNYVQTWPYTFITHRPNFNDTSPVLSTNKTPYYKLYIIIHLLFVTICNNHFKIKPFIKFVSQYAFKFKILIFHIQNCTP